MNSLAKIPVHLITGFLGSGKTTFLNHLAKEVQERILVIENEVGKVNVDGAMLMEGVEDVLELSAGCLCCSLSDGLLDVLEMASARRSEFDRLVIETTGIADPSSIVQVFLSDPGVSRVFELQQVIGLVDAVHIDDWIQQTDEALRQVAMSDVLLINKADQVEKGFLTQLTNRLAKINPNAVTYVGAHGQFPVAEVLGELLSNTESLTNRLNQIEAEYYYREQGAEDYKHPITSFTLEFEYPFVLKELSLQLYRLVNLYRDQVYRVKGVMSVADYPNKVILQSVRTSSVVSDGMPWDNEESRISKLVFIGRGLEKQAFERMFRKYLATPQIT